VKVQDIDLPTPHKRSILEIFLIVINNKNHSFEDYANVLGYDLIENFSSRRMLA